jgi:hypothetical protein
MPTPINKEVLAYLSFHLKGNLNKNGKLSDVSDAEIFGAGSFRKHIFLYTSVFLHHFLHLL